MFYICGVVMVVDTLPSDGRRLTGTVVVVVQGKLLKRDRCVSGELPTERAMKCHGRTSNSSLTS